jgi:cellulose biosynthesis protein BcsQ
MKLIDCDPEGNQRETITSETVSIQVMNPEKEKIQLIDNCVYDLGGFDYSDVASELLKFSDFIIIPSLPSFRNLDNSIKTYNSIVNISKDMQQKICFVIVRYFEENDISEAKNYLMEQIGNDDIQFFQLKNSRGIQSAENRGISIFELANETPLNKRSYKKLCDELNELFNYIEE